MSFIETMPEDDIKKLAERLQQYIVPKSEQKDIKSVNQIYTVKDVSLLIKKSKQTIRSHIDAGLIVAKKVGKNYVITEENLIKYIENEK